MEAQDYYDSSRRAVGGIGSITSHVEEGDEDEDVSKLAQADSLPVTHAADISLRL